MTFSLVVPELVQQDISICPYNESPFPLFFESEGAWLLT